MPIKTTPLLWDFLSPSPGLSLFSLSPIFPKYQFVFIYFWWVLCSFLCSLMIHYLWELRLFYPQVCLCFPLSLSRFLMPISALVSLINHGFVEIVLLLDISYYTYDFFYIHVWFYFAFESLLGFFFGYTSYFIIYIWFFVFRPSYFLEEKYLLLAKGSRHV